MPLRLRRSSPRRLSRIAVQWQHGLALSAGCGGPRIGLDDLDRLVELGLITPDDEDQLKEGAVRRVGLIASLTGGGIPIEALATALEAGLVSLDFLDDPAYEHFSALSPVTFNDMSGTTGIAVEVLTAIREAIGSAAPHPSDRMREIELAVLPMIQAQLESGYPIEAVERGLRTMGDSGDRGRRRLWDVRHRAGGETS